MAGMRKSRLSKFKQDRLIEHFVAGTTARCAASLVGVNFKTSAYFYHPLRELIFLELARQEEEVFGGEIKVVESAEKRGGEVEVQQGSPPYLAC